MLWYFFLSMPCWLAFRYIIIFLFLSVNISLSQAFTPLYFFRYHGNNSLSFSITIASNRTAASLAKLDFLIPYNILVKVLNRNRFSPWTHLFFLKIRKERKRLKFSILMIDLSFICYLSKNLVKAIFMLILSETLGFIYESNNQTRSLICSTKLAAIIIPVLFLLFY